ncbi:hypothetical protein JCM10914A_54810 [Paenibacillus sp. JCM 10914]|uniref:flagellar hook-length control protein FliK n=1 Tax=Paenibacillus sp. JCM 10914 TaxID=1236974 RepID=UPI0003CCA957|nr:flagellar hook-length control protein FliK [Paenibacillus sp. JCM 10914]GAE04777.1 flagellar hook-length control protein FliK [Paenibacillus sp. JCM 10914]
MTMMVQNMTSSVSSSSGSKAGSASKGAEGASFENALTYQMSGSSTNATAGKEVSARLESMFSGLQAETNEELESLVALLEGLIKELDLMDEAVKEDPALLQEIQLWLQQANLLLGGNGSQPLGTDQASVGSSLASSADTIRFAVQDTVSQLAAVLSKPGNADVNTEAAVKQLVQSFHSMVGSGTGTHKAGSFASVLSPQQTESSSILGTSNSSAGQGAPQQSAVAAGTLPGGRLLTYADPLSTEATTGEGEISPEHGPVTAGQLALRSGTQVTVKPAAPPVPVEQFSNEMTSFIINKFEIVKQQGFTEARISLNPQHLGQVDIKLSMQNGQLIAQFMTKSTDAKELIDQQIATLRTALIAQGLQVEKIEVTQSSQSSTSQLYQDGRQPGSGQQQSQHRSNEKDRPSEDAILAAALTEEWNEWIDENQGDEELTQTGRFTAEA